MPRRFSGAASQSYNAGGWSTAVQQPWSVCGWVYPFVPSAANSYLFYSADSGSSILALRLYYDSGSAGPGVWIYAEGSAQYFTPVLAGQWQHLGMTYDGVNTLRTYHQGILKTTVTYTLTGGTHTALYTGCFDATTILENAQIKYWEGYRLSDAEMLAEKGWKGVATQRSALLAHWQLENGAPTADSSGNGYTLSGVASAGLESEPTQPIGVTTLNTSTRLVEGPIQQNRAAALLTTATTFVEGGVSSGMRNALSTLTSGSRVLPAGTVLKTGATTLATTTAFVAPGTSIKNASTTLVSGTLLLPITVTAVKNGAVVLATGTLLQAQGLLPKFGAASLTTGTRLLPSAAQRLNAATKLSTGSTLSALARMTVTGAATLQTGSTISAYSAISAVAPVWFSDEPRTAFETHTAWSSNPSAQ